ncbi:capsid protein [Crucivirus-392]|nr:capsid protein [Crucivirus-392]
MPRKRTRSTTTTSIAKAVKSGVVAGLNAKDKAAQKAKYGYRRVLRDAQTLATYGPTLAQASSAQRDARLADQYYGRGMYMGGKGMYMGGKGGYWAQLFGAKKGGWLDKAADSVSGALGLDSIAGGAASAHQAIMNAANGIGDYTTNNIVDGGQGSAFEPPTFTAGDASSVLISHKEYLSDVYGPPTASLYFENRSISINPGLEQCFPWLSQVANNYEEYEIKQLIFTFKSTVAPIGASASGQVGQVIMATQYDVQDPPFNDKDTMLRYALSASCKATDSAMHGVECDPAKLSGSVGKYVRSSPVGDDLRDYDLGVFNIATANMPDAYANQSIGELWVSYTVLLRKPKINSGKGFAINTDIYCAAYLQANPIATIAAGPMIVQDPAAFKIASGIMKGQSNAIQTKLSVQLPTVSPGALQSKQLKITFPGWYSGNVEIKYGFSLWETGGNLANIREVIYEPFGNISVINDVLALNVANQPAWTFQETGGEIQLGSGEGAMYRNVSYGHFRIGLPQNGVENYVLVSILTWEAGSQVIKKCMEMLKIDEYNTVGNYLQSGVDDKPVLLNSAGTVALLANQAYV